jgi:hypothetical protein
MILVLHGDSGTTFISDVNSTIYRPCASLFLRMKEGGEGALNHIGLLHGEQLHRAFKIKKSLTPARDYLSWIAIPGSVEGICAQCFYRRVSLASITFSVDP